MGHHLKKFAGLLFVTSFSAFGAANEHPCTGAPLPLTSEAEVVAAVECLYEARVARVSLAETSERAYDVRILSDDGRVKTIRISAASGLEIVE